MTKRMLWWLGALVIAAEGCDGGQASPVGLEAARPFVALPESSLTFLRPAPYAPSLAQTSVSFWAVRGQTRQAEILYQNVPGVPAPNRLVRFRVDKTSLVNRPNGTPILPGDSIRITMTVVDTIRMIVDFQPAGLVFSTRKPARITFWYLEADHDFNGDGVINATDTELESSFRIWGEEQPGDPWNSLSSVPSPGTDQVEARVPGFTRYAVSY